MQQLKTNLLHLACRHHIFEIMIEKAFVVCVGSSFGPEVALFKRFQQQWQSNDHSKFTTLKNKETTAMLINPSVVNDLIQFAEGCLNSIQPRDDYHELLQLWIVILGNVQPGGQMISFRQPGALHRARWMAKQIYAIKIYLFHEQFSLTARELKGLLDFILFIVQVYLKAWFQAPLGIQAQELIFSY